MGFFYCTLGNTITDIKKTRHGLTGLMGRKKHWILRGLLLFHSGEYNNRYKEYLTRVDWDDGQEETLDITWASSISLWGIQ